MILLAAFLIVVLLLGHRFLIIHYDGPAAIKRPIQYVSRKLDPPELRDL